MNRVKWNNSYISLPVLAAKFAEEAGEVSGAIADMEAELAVPWPDFEEAATQIKQRNLLKIREEISHARFLLDLIEERVGG